MPTFDSDGVQIFYQSTGEGFPLIWSHEFAGSYESWEQQVRYFSHRYQVITYNDRGYPPSEVPTDPEAYSQDITIEDLRRLMEHLGTGRGIHRRPVDGRQRCAQLRPALSGAVPGHHRGIGGIRHHPQRRLPVGRRSDGGADAGRGHASGDEGLRQRPDAGCSCSGKTLGATRSSCACCWGTTPGARPTPSAACS